VASKLNFTEEQMVAIQAITEFATDMFTPSWYFVFTGPAGSGKTACMMEVQSKMNARKLNCVFTAPTNKAAKVLRGVVGKAQTTYTFLNLRVAADGAVKRIAKGKDPDLSQIDVLVVDESSMVNKELFAYLEEAAKRWNFRVIFMGDSFQLPPVHEAFSKALQGKSSASLSTVMRHDNQILTFATEVRRQIDSRKPSIKLRDDNDDEEGIWVLDSDDFKHLIYAAAQEGHFSDGETAKVIAWRNVQVAFYNNLIRHAIYGEKAQPGYFLLNERITAGEPCSWGQEPLMHTDEGGVIKGIVEKRHPVYDDFKVFELTVEKDYTKQEVKLLSIHPDSADDLQYFLDDLSTRAKAAPSLWGDFWEAKEWFHDIRYGYAETAHKSQGSTYQDVYVDSADILRNKKQDEAYRCFYVACTRPTTRLILV
jgi:hypothetical protein